LRALVQTPPVNAYEYVDRFCSAFSDFETHRHLGTVEALSNLFGPLVDSFRGVAAHVCKAPLPLAGNGHAFDQPNRGQSKMQIRFALSSCHPHRLQLAQKKRFLVGWTNC
jgi:hypothetical protein